MKTRTIVLSSAVWRAGICFFRAGRTYGNPEGAHACGFSGAGTGDNQRAAAPDSGGGHKVKHPERGQEMQ